MDIKRRKFKADISDKYIKGVMAKGIKKHKSMSSVPRRSTLDPIIINSEPDVTKTISFNSIPKKTSDEHRERDIAKPEHWFEPNKVERPSREEVFEVERDSITKKLKYDKGWRRAAGQLETAISAAKSTTPRGPIIPGENDDDDFNFRPKRPSGDTNSVIIRKNHSREFLDKFFKMADVLAVSKGSS